MKKERENEKGDLIGGEKEVGEGKQKPFMQFFCLVSFKGHDWKPSHFNRQPDSSESPGKITSLPQC